MFWSPAALAFCSCFYIGPGELRRTIQTIIFFTCLDRYGAPGGQIAKARSEGMNSLTRAAWISLEPGSFLLVLISARDYDREIELELS